MKQELQNKIFKKYPDIFRPEKINSNPYKGGSLLSFGLEIGDGWYSILNDACKKIQKICNETSVQVIAEQVKEKFGGLRFYVFVRNTHPPLPEVYFNDIRNNIYKIITDAELLSEKICEECGERAELDKSLEWHKTICSKCKEAYEKNFPR